MSISRYFFPSNKFIAKIKTNYKNLINFMENLTTKAKEVIEKITYLNLATITPEGEPWNSPVYCSYDKDLNFFTMSWHKNQHCINIRNNEKIFFTIYDSTVPASTGFGVYFKGKAQEINNPIEALHGIKHHYNRSKSKARDVAKFLTKFPRRVYKFVPEKVWVNGDSKIEGEPVDIRTELNLEELKKLFND